MNERRRPGGRRPLDPDDPSVTVTVAMPSKQYDVLYALAQKQAQTVPAVIRQALEQTTKPDPKKR